MYCKLNDLCIFDVNQIQYKMRELKLPPMKELPLKIVGVNVSPEYANANGNRCSGYDRKSVKPIEGPWGFDYIKTEFYRPKFLVAVDHSYTDSIEGCYDVIDVCDAGDDGVLFELTRCSAEDEALVKELIKGKDLSGWPYKVLLGF